MAAVPKSNDIELQNKLKALVPINALHDADRELLLKQASVAYLKKGGFLFNQGDVEAKNIYLLSGEVDLLQGKKVVDSLAANTEAARYALAHQLPRKLSCRAKRGGVEYLSVDSHNLGELLEKAREGAFTVDEAEEEDESDWMSQLLMSPVVQLIPPSNIQNVMIRMEEVKTVKGEEVVRQGDEGSYFYLIHKGSCIVTRKTNDSDEPEELACLNAGDSFGEEALLSDSKRGGTVTMLTDGILQRLSKEDFITFIKHPLAKEISYPEAVKIIENDGLWLDVRDPKDYQSDHLEKSINIPIQSLRFQVPSLAADTLYVVCCTDGRKSTAAAFLLMEQGLDVVILQGGIKSIPSTDQSDKKHTETHKTGVISTINSSVSSDEFSALQKERDEAVLKAKTYENRFLKIRETFEASQSKLLAKMAALQQHTTELKAKLQIAEKAQQVGTEEGASVLQTKLAEQEKQISKLMSEKRQLEAELEILLAASEENDQAGIEAVKELKQQLSELQQQLLAGK